MVLLIMDDWWGSLSSAEQVFWGISIVFSVLFIIQFVISLIGLDFDHDTDIDVHADVDVHGDIDVHATSDTDYSLDPDFTLLSVRSIIAFFTFFGWTGVMILGKGGGIWQATGFACLAGFAAMFVVGYMVYQFSKLSQSGTVNMKDAVYKNGEVYLTIPAYKNGVGKVHIKIQGSLRELDAITEGETLQTGSQVKIIKVLDDNLLLVEPVQSLLEELK